MIPKRGGLLPDPETASVITDADVALAKKRAAQDATPSGRAMLDATLLPADERAKGPVADV